MKNLSFCKECGATLEADNIFCPSCGTPITPSTRSPPSVPTTIQRGSRPGSASALGESITKIIDDFSKNQLIGYFLILWGATFFFSAMSSFVWLAKGYGSGIDIIVEGLWALSEIGCTAILVMLGLKTLNKQ